jgi:hypothetical protein
MIAILDGTPTGVRGQSLVELTLTLPILMVMLLGLTEIGWYANNYLTLLDVVREAGRAGANATGARDPIEGWSPGEELNYHRLDCDESLLYYDKETLPEDHIEDPQGPVGYPTNSPNKYFIGDERPLGFYDWVACTVIPNMAPLEFNDETDDIVVSVFSYFFTGRETANPRVRIPGRYPVQTNECDGDDPWDPFDTNHNGTPLDAGEEFDLFDDGADNVRGYVFRGNHELDFETGTPCLGSEFSTQEVESMLNLSNVPLADRREKLEHVPDYGLVLVEIFWEHNQLLGLPWYNLGPLDEAQVIHVWTFFPVSAAEPDL